MNQSLNTQKLPDISHPRASNGVSLVRIWKKISCTINGIALYLYLFLMIPPLATTVILSSKIAINPIRIGRCGSNGKIVISEHMLQIKFISTYEFNRRWMP